MKILIVRLWPYEININSYNCQEIGLAKAIIRKGNICDIVLYTNGENKEVDFEFDNNKKIHIYYLTGKNFFKNCLYNNYIKNIVKNYDVIQSSEYDQIFNLKLKRISNNKLIIYHGPYDCKYNKGYPKKCIISDFIYLFNPKFKKNHILTKSELASSFLIKKGYSNVVSVGVGIDLERFNDAVINADIEKLIKMKSEYNLKYLLYIGKIEERRNVYFLLDILKFVLSKNKNIKMIIVGSGEKEYVKNFMDYIFKNNLNENIVYIESLKQEELTNLYKISDIFLLPTNYEIFGMVMLESMYFGVPIITTLNGGSSTLIKNNNSGIIINNFSVNEWSNAIVRLLNDEVFYQKISSTSKKVIIDNFTWDKLSEKFLDNYNEL